MQLKTRSTVTLTLTGAEAQKLAVWMYQKGAANSNSQPYEPVAAELLTLLQDLPEEED